ncbi:MAG TPA: hypothetical protein VFI17_14105 [Solirubrobacterales bacterium]|nr:hypothetical protein [Solirubrobacterales bacterium]
MTESRRPARPSGARVFWVTVLLFAALFALLTYRFAVGRDPSLSATATAPQPVQVRKVIKRRVITTIVPSPGQNSVSAGPATSSSYSSGSEPVLTSAS